MGCPALGILGQNLTFSIQYNDGTGAACDATGNVVYNVYEDETAAPIIADGTMTKLASKTGFYSEQIEVSLANSFEKFKSYTIRIVATIAGVEVSRVFSFLCLGSDTIAGGEVTGLICTVDDIKDRLGIDSDDYNDVLARIVTSLEGIFNSFTQRKLIIPVEDVTEYYTPEGGYLQLNRYPVAGTPTSLKQATDYDFDSADALVENEGYRLMKEGKKGIIFFPCGLLHYPDSLQIVYRGGYCSAGSEPGEDETAMPADLREAAIEQGCFIFKRKDDIGLAGVSAPGGSISKFSAMDLLPMVKETLKLYRRPSL